MLIPSPMRTYHFVVTLVEDTNMEAVIFTLGPRSQNIILPAHNEQDHSRSTNAEHSSTPFVGGYTTAAFASQIQIYLRLKLLLQILITILGQPIRNAGILLLPVQ